MLKFAAITVLLFSLSSSSFAQGCTTYVMVTAFDKRSGDTVDNLNGDDFEARMDGKEIPILSASHEFNKRILVLLETDGRRSDRVDEAVDLATRLVRQAPDGESFAFGVFAKRSVFTDGFIEDEGERRLAINAVFEEADHLGENAAMYNALHDSLRVFGSPQPGDTVLLISDGYDVESNRSASEVEREFLAHGTRLIMMFRQPPSDVTGNFMWKPPQRDRAILHDWSIRSGGVYTTFDPYSFSQVSHGYLLAIRLPEGGKPHSWKLRLRSSSLISPRRVQLYYPERLQPCSDPAAVAQTVGKKKTRSTPERAFQ